MAPIHRTVYRIVKHFFYKLEQICSFCRTSLLFFFLGVKHENFSTHGTPIARIKNGSIKIGKNFTMNNGLHANTIGFSTPCIFLAENANLTLGDNIGMSQTALIASGADITIGNNVLMGGGIKIYSTDFHSLDFMHRRVFDTDKKNKKTSPIHIGNDVFIGAGAIILKGVTIGDRSIVGAGSIVTKSIPSDEIWAGNPAKFIRKI